MKTSNTSIVVDNLIRAECGAKTRDGDPCKNAPVTGSKRCRMHGGAGSGRPPIHGRYSLKHRAALAEKAQRFLEDPRPGDLTDELALMRALLQDYLDRFPDGVALPAKELERMMGMVETISQLVERIARIMNQSALTQAEVRFLEARLADLILKYVDNADKQLAFLDELAAVVGVDPADSGAGRAALAVA